MNLNLKLKRESRNMTQAQLAEKSGIPIRAVQYYEQGALDLSHSRLDKVFDLAMALDCDILDILDDGETSRKIKRYYGDE